MSHVILHAEPCTPPMSWHGFWQNRPGYAIALDGYVIGGPKFLARGPFANFNHHEQVDRLATRATCAQVLMAIRQGLFDAFRGNDGPRAHVFVNDCDEDVCTAWFLLRHAHLALSAVNPLLNRLVAMEDALDTTAGAYPYPADLPALCELAWVFEPYRRFRLSGRIDRRDPEDFADVITNVEDRIMRHIVGNGAEIALDLRYEVMRATHRWTMVREIGAQARTALFANGVHAFVSVRPRSDGRWAYSIGRMSPFVPFNVPGLLRALDAEEGHPTEHWGGGDTIGGSPRAAGSRLSPDDVTRIIEDATKVTP